MIAAAVAFFLFCFFFLSLWMTVEMWKTSKPLLLGWSADLCPGIVRQRSQTAGRARPRYEFLPPTSRRLAQDFRARPKPETTTHTQMMSLEDSL